MSAPILLVILLGAAQSTGQMSPTSDVSSNRVKATGASTARAIRDHLRTLPDVSWDAVNDGSASVTSTGSTTARSHKDRWSDVVNVKDYGAACDGTTDDTAAIQAAIATGKKVQVSSGDCHVVGTVVVGASGYLELLAGSKLHRLAADTSTDEIVRVSGPWSTLDGAGWIQSDKASPRGVVRLGQADASGGDAVLRSAIRGITVQGVKASGNVGIYAYSSEGYSGPGFLYESQIRDVHIRNLGTAIRLDQQVNGNSISGVEAYQIADYVYHLTTCSENTIANDFTHFSSNVTVIKGQGSQYNHFYGIMAEPGGVSSRFYDFDATSFWNLVTGNGNTGTVSIDAGTDNTEFTGRMLSTPALRLRDGPSTTHFGRVLARSSIPTAASAPSGGWVKGDIVINSDPSVGATWGWIAVGSQASFPPDGWWEALAEPIRKIRFDPAAPASTTTETQGSIVFNSAPSNGAPMGWAAYAGGNPGTWVALPRIYPEARVDPAFGTTVAIDPGQGHVFEVVANAAGDFAIANPSNAAPDQVITVRVYNTSGGALGTVTWGNKYKMATWANPAAGANSAITFRYRIADLTWQEVARVIDIPN